MLLRTRQRHDHGQATVALVGVLAFGFYVALAVALVGQAMVHRGRAQNAADAVALAAVSDRAAADTLSDWYLHQGVVIQLEAGRASASSGPAQAAAWASLVEGVEQPAPVLVASLARAEQLVGVTFQPVRWHKMTFELRLADARELSVVAADLGLCATNVDAAGTGWRGFELC